MQNANKKKITGAVALAAAGVMALGGVSMLFTDHADVSGKTTAGKLAVEVTGTNLTDGDFTKQLENTEFVDAVQNLNPGDVRTISYSINNAENKAMRTNDTLTVTVTPNETVTTDQETTVSKMFEALKAGSFDGGSAIHLVEGKKGVNGEVTTNTDPAAADYKTTVEFPDTGLTMQDAYLSKDGKSIVLVYQGDEVSLTARAPRQRRLPATMTRLPPNASTRCTSTRTLATSGRALMFPLALRFLLSSMPTLLLATLL